MMIKLGKRMMTALVLTSTCMTSPLQAAPVPLDSIAAIASDGVILRSELDRRITLISDQLRNRGTTLPPADVLRRQVLDQMIIESLQLQEGSNRGIRIPDELLNHNLQRIAERLGMTLAQYRQQLENSGSSYNEVRRELRRTLLLQKIQQNMVGRQITISEQEIANYLDSTEGREKSRSEYKLSHILISVPAQATPEMIQQAEKKAQAVWQQLNKGADFSAVAAANSNATNALNGGDLGWRQGDEMPPALSDVLRGMKKGAISAPIRNSSGFHILQVRDKRGGTVQLVNQARVSHILIKPSEIRDQTQTRRLINRLHRRITEDGEDFAVLAQEYSDDTTSGSEGGDLGWVQNGQMVPAFETMMHATPTGAISRPFESRFGWHILQVRERRQHDMGEEMLANQARSTIRNRKFNEELTSWLRELRSQAFIEIKN
ncbi:MAG: peptidylprolyl isomerase [Marinobacterium sp.]|nr:peptidylprolyl isomerase [Marinobacterium sp.]